VARSKKDVAMDDKKDIEKAIENELRDLCLRIEAKLNYRPTALIDMIEKYGGLKTVKRLIDRPEPSSGYKKLARLDELDFTAEMLLLENEEWHSLFKYDTIMTAVRRINQTNKERKLALKTSYSENTI
jgi:hypothetical protein